MMNIKLLKIWRGLLTVLLLVIVSQSRAAYLTSLDQVESGKYYRIYSLAYNTTMAMAETSTGSYNVFCDVPNAQDYMQVWKIVVSASTATKKTVTIQNAVSGRWINRSFGGYITWPTGQNYYMELTGTGFVIYPDANGFHHQQSGHNVVAYDVNADASKWQLEEAEIDAEALAAQQVDYNNYVSLVNNRSTITSALSNYFTDSSCSELKSPYTSYSDDELQNEMKSSELPQMVIDMALKVKNHAWEVYDDGWSHTEQHFRIADYQAVSKESRWRNIVKVGYALSPNSDPTGIYVQAGDIITVYVGNIADDTSLLLRNVPKSSATGDAYTLAPGFNILKIQSEGCLFVDYEADNTTNGAAPYKPLSQYADVTIHIEGGLVNGAFSTLRGDSDADWALMKEKLFKHFDYLQLRSRKKIFNMRADYVLAACPEKMVEMLEEWDKIVEMEHGVMGLNAEFGDYFNTPMMAVSITGSSHMYASSFGTYYNETTLSDVMSYDNLFAGGSLWGPAHEIGHINQAVINIIGQSEVSNNLFSNIAVFNNGHLTSRADYISTTFQNMSNGMYWQSRELWERTHLYFQLYQFCQIQGYRPNFYPDFFKALRADPCTRVKDTFVDATDDYLKFYKKACEVSGYDLTELFQAYGFFIVPQQTSYTLKGVTKNAFQVGDYGTFYLVVTQDMIDAAIAEVKAMHLPKANIVFIEDRVTAPDATYEGVISGTKKTGYYGFPIGKGDVGQYTDFIPTVAAEGYRVSYIEDADGNLDVQVNHTNGTGVVGFKVYSEDGNLVFLSNTYEFSVPTSIYSQIKNTNFRVVAAGPDGNDQEMETDNEFLEWVVKDKATGEVLIKHFQHVIEGQEISDYPAELSAPYVALPALTAFTYHATSTEKEIEVEATLSVPFSTSTDTQAIYYYVKVRNGYLHQDDTKPTLSPTSTDSPLYKWAFYGNPYKGYRLKNLATGQWLCAESGSPVMRSTASTYWLITATAQSDKFLLGIPSNTSQHANLNDAGGQGSNLILYKDNSSAITVSGEAPITIPTVDINLTSQLSSFSYPSPVVVPDDVNIFIATSTANNVITVQWLDTKVIPANTGVLLYSNGGGTKTLSLGAWVDSDVTTAYTLNTLLPTADSPYIVQAADNIYALRNGQTAFARVETGVRIAAYKAYLQSVSEARLLLLDFGATGISQVIDLSVPADGSIYNLSGQRVSNAYKGIVIINGKKVVKR